jgi:trehalose-phosphatase
MTSLGPEGRRRAPPLPTKPLPKQQAKVDKRSGLGPGRNDLGRERGRGVFRPSRDSRPHYLFDCWSKVAARVQVSDSLVLFLDFDGTLVELRRRPEDACLDASTRRVLTRLARHPRVTLCFISGRRRADLHERVRIPGAYYWGLHGWERGSDFVSPAPAHHLFEMARQQIETRVRGLPGIWIEDKKVSLVVHYRDAPKPAVRQAALALRELLTGRRSQLRVQPGINSWEVMPRAFAGKGAAVQRLLASLPASTLPFYAGDDASDESAFRVLRRGITIHVGCPPGTRARYFVRSPAEVVSFLEKLSGEIA